MSVAALNWAFTAPMTDATAKAVLIALANYADAEGRCWPSIPTLALNTALDQRTVERALTRLVGFGALSATRSTGKANRYLLDLQWAGQTPGTAPPPAQRRPGTAPVHPRHSAAPTPGAASKTPGTAPPEPLEPPFEPSREPSVPRAARQGDRGTRLDPGWLPSDADRAFAVKAGLNPDVVAEEFRDYWIGCPGARGHKADWPATFRNWCRKNAERSKPRASGQNGHAAKPAFRNGWTELVHTRFLADGIDGDGHDPQDVAPAASGDPIDAGSGGVLAARPRRAH